MIIPVRCFTCGCVIGDKWKIFVEESLQEKKKSKEKVDSELDIEYIDTSKVQIPGTGVYAVRIIYQNNAYDAVANIGFNPTFHRDRLSVEVHIFDFNQLIYGKEVEVEFISRIRSEIEFKSKDELVVQIKKDIEKAKVLLEGRN